MTDAGILWRSALWEASRERRMDLSFGALVMLAPSASQAHQISTRSEPPPGASPYELTHGQMAVIRDNLPRSGLWPAQAGFDLTTWRLEEARTFSLSPVSQDRPRQRQETSIQRNAPMPISPPGVRFSFSAMSGRSQIHRCADRQNRVEMLADSAMNPAATATGRSTPTDHLARGREPFHAYRGFRRGLRAIASAVFWLARRDARLATNPRLTTPLGRRLEGRSNPAPRCPIASSRPSLARPRGRKSPRI